MGLWPPSPRIRWELQTSQLGATMDGVATGGAKEMNLRVAFPTMHGDKRDQGESPHPLKESRVAWSTEGGLSQRRPAVDNT